MRYPRIHSAAPAAAAVGFAVAVVMLPLRLLLVAAGPVGWAHWPSYCCLPAGSLTNKGCLSHAECAANSEAPALRHGQWCKVAYSAKGGDASTDDSEGLILDKNKETAIKNWLEHTADAVIQLVTKHLDSIQWKFCAFSEKMLRLPYLWVDSVMTLPASTESVPQGHLPGERTLGIDWRLPLSAAGQTLLYHRVIADYTRTTGGLDAADRRRYRKSEQESS